LPSRYIVAFAVSLRAAIAGCLLQDRFGGRQLKGQSKRGAQQLPFSNVNP